MIVTYGQARGVLRVGDEVTRVRGRENRCVNLGGLDAGVMSGAACKTAKITKIDGDWFYVNKCFHSFAEDGWLEILNRGGGWGRLEQAEKVCVGERQDEYEQKRR